jgi:hypothetical protein
MNRIMCNTAYKMALLLIKFLIDASVVLAAAVVVVVVSVLLRTAVVERVSCAFPAVLRYQSTKTVVFFKPCFICSFLRDRDDELGLAE